MSILDHFNTDTPKLTIGDIKFEILVAISNVIERDAFKDEAKFKKGTARAVVWFVDDTRFHNHGFRQKSRSKEDKLKDFTNKLLLLNEIQSLTHTGLNAIGIVYCKVVRAEPEYKKHIITVSFDMGLYKTTQDKHETRSEQNIADATDSSQTAAAIAKKTNQAQADQIAGNSFFDAINKLLKPLYD